MKKSWVLLLAMCATVLFSCKSKEDEPQVTPQPKPQVTELQLNEKNIGNYSATFEAVPVYDDKFYYVTIYEKGYIEESKAEGMTEFDLNEIEVGKLEYYYYIDNGEEGSPYDIASTYMKQDTQTVMFTGLKKNTEYTAFGFFYDWEQDLAGDVLYRVDFKTGNGGGGKVYPVEMDIVLEWQGTTLVATPSILTQTFLFDALPGSVVESYTTAEELAEAVYESYSRYIPASVCNTGVSSYYFDDMCSAYYDEETIVGYAFGVDASGQICSQPVRLELTNPYYGVTSYDNYYYAPIRKNAKLAWK